MFFALVIIFKVKKKLSLNTIHENNILAKISQFTLMNEKAFLCERMCSHYIALIVVSTKKKQHNSNTA